MGSFGDRLRREREQRGISLDDIALTTKIRAGLLKALEEEKFDQLPGGIFNKGFVRAYARHLGIDEDQAVADYLVASGAIQPPLRKPLEAAGPNHAEAVHEPRIQLVREEREPTDRSPSPWGLWAGLLVLVIVGVVAWAYYHRERSSEEPAASGAPPVSTASSSGAATNPSPASPPSNQPSAATPASQSGSKLAGAAPASPAAKVGGNPGAATTSGSFTVRLKADDDCWMQIEADGKSQEFTLAAAEEKLITAKSKVVVRAGNVGALQVSFNGNKLASQGESGEVKTLTFSPEGLQAAAVRPAAPAQ